MLELVQPADQQRDQGEPSLIAGITRQVMRDYPVDPQRVYVAGLSAGGAAAAIMGATYPDLYAAIGVHSGLARGAASDMPSAFAAMQRGGPCATAAGRPAPRGSCRRSSSMATSDTTVNPRNGDQVIAQARWPSAPTFRRRQRHSRVRSPAGEPTAERCMPTRAGRPVLEQWVIHGAGHAWSGGSSAGTYTDPQGPDATREMLRFFMANPHPDAGRPVTSRRERPAG